MDTLFCEIQKEIQTLIVNQIQILSIDKLALCNLKQAMSRTDIKNTGIEKI